MSLKIAFFLLLLVGVNVLWFWMLRAMTRHGYPVSYTNFLADLKYFHLLIVDTKASHERHVLTFALIVLYLLIATLVGGIFLSLLL